MASMTTNEKNGGIPRAAVPPTAVKNPDGKVRVWLPALGEWQWMDAPDAREVVASGAGSWTSTVPDPEAERAGNGHVSHAPEVTR